MRDRFRRALAHLDLGPVRAGRRFRDPERRVRAGGREEQRALVELAERAGHEHERARHDAVEQRQI